MKSGSLIFGMLRQISFLSSESILVKRFLKASFVCVVSNACLLSSVYAQDAKIDVLGVWIGMPTAELVQLGQSKKWRCGPGATAPVAYTCFTERGQMSIYTAAGLSGAPVMSLTLVFQSGASHEDIVASIAEQYRKQATPVRIYDRDGHASPHQFTQWILSNGSKLELTDSNYLKLESETLMRANDKAILDKAAAASPPPKF